MVIEFGPVLSAWHGSRAPGPSSPRGGALFRGSCSHTPSVKHVSAAHWINTDWDPSRPYFRRLRTLSSRTRVLDSLAFWFPPPLSRAGAEPERDWGRGCNPQLLEVKRERINEGGIPWQSLDLPHFALPKSLLSPNQPPPQEALVRRTKREGGARSPIITASKLGVGFEKGNPATPRPPRRRRG